MKTFLLNNWYKLILSCSFFFLSLSLFIFSISSTRASSYNNKMEIGFGSKDKIEVNIANEQIELILKTILQDRVIKIDERQFNELKPKAIQSVDIKKLNGTELCTEIVSYQGKEERDCAKFYK